MTDEQSKLLELHSKIGELLGEYQKIRGKEIAAIKIIPDKSHYGIQDRAWVQFRLLFED